MSFADKWFKHAQVNAPELVEEKKVAQVAMKIYRGNTYVKTKSYQVEPRSFRIKGGSFRFVKLGTEQLVERPLEYLAGVSYDYPSKPEEVVGGVY